MDLHELESFVAVCGTGSFTQAAHQRGMTQPGISRHIQRLEHELNVQLLLRGQGALRITEAGRRLLTYAEDTLARHQALVQALHGTGGALSGELRIAASTTPGEFLLPSLLATFNERHPEVRPQLFISDSVAVAEELSEGRWDLGFVGVRVDGRKLRYDIVEHDEIVLAVPAAHPFAMRTEVAASELEGQPIVEREGGSGTLRSFRRALKKHGAPTPRYRTVMVLNSGHAILAAVRRGVGLGIVSSLEFQQDTVPGVAMVRIADVPLGRDLYMVRSVNKPLPAQADAFARWVIAQAESG